MNDKATLLHQLRVNRPAQPPPARGRLGLWLFLGLGCLAAAGIAWYLLAPDSRIPVHVVTARATAPGAAAAASLLDASGYVVARRQATVSAKITGKVVKVLIEEGQHVDEGDVIAVLDDTNTRAALEESKAQLAEAEANLVTARTSLADAKPIFARQEKLAALGWVSGADLDNARASYDASRTNLTVLEQSLAVAKAALQVAERNQDDTVVRAPYAGIVTVKAAQPGEIVSPLSAGGGFTRTGIGTIVDMNSLEVEVDVSENFIHRVHPDQPATVKLNAYPDWQIPASVIAVIPTADRSKATVKVRVGMKEKDPRILPEMGARVAFLGDAPVETSGTRPQPGVIVPDGAVDGKGESGLVFLIRDDRVERRSVRLGAATADGQIVLSGVAPGDRLAVGDFSKLVDQAPIRVVSGPE